MAPVATRHLRFKSEKRQSLLRLLNHRNSDAVDNRLENLDIQSYMKQCLASKKKLGYPEGLKVAASCPPGPAYWPALSRLSSGV